MLTKTETKISKGIALGYSEKELAAKLYVSEHTVHTHTRNIRKKLSLRSNVDIARTYILSLENPKTLLKATLFFIIQLGMICNGPMTEMRKPVSRTQVSRTKTRSYEN